MVEINLKFITFAVMMNAIMFSIFSIMPINAQNSIDGIMDVDQINQSTGVLNENRIVNFFSEFNPSIGVLWNLYYFIKFMTGGIITVSGLPFIVSIVITSFFWIVNVMLIYEIYSWLRELVGFV